MPNSTSTISVTLEGSEADSVTLSLRQKVISNEAS